MAKLKKTTRAIKPYEKIVAFDKHNRKSTFRPDRVRVLKIYDTKKRKYVGTFNKTDNKGRLIAKYFGRVQYRMYHLYKAPHFAPPIGPGISFAVNPKKYVKFQIPKRVIDHVQKHAIQGGRSFQIQIDIVTSKRQREKHTRNPAYLLTKGNTADDIRKIITNEAICAAVGNNLRFSPIVYARGQNKIKRQISRATIRITYASPPKGVIHAKKVGSHKASRQVSRNKKNKKGSKRKSR